MNAITYPAIRWHGAKFRLATWITQFFPPHRTYVEPFGGGAGVLIQKARAYSEVYNDLDGEIVNFFRCLRDPDLCSRLVEAITLTPYAREEFETAYEPADEPVERARRLCMRAQMGFGGAGATQATTGFRIDSKRDYGTTMQLWAKYPEGLQAIGRRFAEVLVENRPAGEVIGQHDDADTLHFIDPPYVHDTRKMGWSAKYRFEMSDEDHVALIAQLRTLQGMVVLSGYPSDLYQDMLNDWGMYSTPARISAGRGTAIRTETVWLNPHCHELYRQGSGLLL